MRSFTANSKDPVKMMSSTYTRANNLTPVELYTKSKVLACDTINLSSIRRLLRERTKHEVLV
jgi:hypothetical protein